MLAASSSRLATRPGTEIVPPVLIFAPAAYEFAEAGGAVRTETFSDADLRQIFANFQRLYTGDGVTTLKPLVTVSHRPSEQFGTTDPRCHGIVGEDLHFRGDALYASLVDVPRATAGMIRRGELRNGSPEIRRQFKHAGKDYGHVLTRFALLGKDQPRVKRGELPYEFAEAPAGSPLPRPTYFLPVADTESVLCFSEALTVTTTAEPTPVPAPTAPDLAAETARLRDEMLAGLRQELRTFADDQRAALTRELETAKAHAAQTAKLERERLDREKRDKIKRFLDEPGLCFADAQRHVRILPVQRAFFEEALLREDAGDVLTFADGDKQIQGTALDRKMAEIRRFPPQLDFSDKLPGQKTPGQTAGPTGDVFEFADGERAPTAEEIQACEEYVLSGDPVGKAEWRRRKALTTAK